MNTMNIIPIRMIRTLLSAVAKLIAAVVVAVAPKVSYVFRCVFSNIHRGFDSDRSNILDYLDDDDADNSHYEQ